MSKLTVPDFPTTIGIFTGANAAQPGQSPRVVTNGQLVCPYVYSFANVEQEWASKTFLLLLLPYNTDIRGMESPNAIDWVQVPNGTANWYLVVQVQDRWLGYSGHHLIAQLWPRVQ